MPSAVILLCGLFVLRLCGPWMFDQLMEVMRGTYETMGGVKITTGSVKELMSQALVLVAVVLMPLFLGVVVSGLAGNVAQVGLFISPESLAFKPEKLNPIKGLRRLLSLKSLAELVKSILKIVLIGGIAYLVMRKEFIGIASLMELSVGEILAFICRVSVDASLYVCLALIVLAGADYAFQKWDYEKDMKMSKQELKEESKQQEGDPKVKARIRRIQMEMSRKRMMDAVPDADVVITNPTHLSIAIKYDFGTMAAPKVTAKGAERIAFKIREIAREHGVPIVENKQLARALYASSEIGDSVPVDLYRAVAEVLAYIYRLNNRRIQ